MYSPQLEAKDYGMVLIVGHDEEEVEAALRRPLGSSVTIRVT